MTLKILGLSMYAVLFAVVFGFGTTLVVKIVSGAILVLMLLAVVFMAGQKFAESKRQDHT